MDYLDILDSYKEEMLESLKTLVRIPSVQSKPVKTADGDILPFGRPVQDALEAMLAEGRSMGFDTFNGDNYGGHIEWKCEDSKEVFGIAGHLDVVPEGDGWKYGPFNPTVEDGCIIGRGVSDDKGPLVAVLYALKALKESGIQPNKNIRIILGLDEEKGVDGINRYLEIAGQPDLGITPDAGFPLINGEKGILVFELAQKLTRSRVKDGLRLTKVEGGTASNAVPAYAKAAVAGDSAQYESIKDRLAQFVLETGYKLKAKKQGPALVIEASGKAAHGARPEDGLNAISVLMSFLGRLQFANEEVNDYIYTYNEKIGFNLHGQGMACDLEDEASGKLIWNTGLISINEDVASITVNVRYPVTKTSDEVYEGIEETLANTRIGIVKQSDMEPIYMPLDDPMVEHLMAAYRDETGDTESQAIVIGGGTYAKALNKTLAFGGLFPGEEDTMHQVDERLSLESFYKMARIYAKAIYLICFRAW